MLKIDPKRVVEIDQFGRFYVMGVPPFMILPIFDPLDERRNGFIVIDQTLSYSSNPYELNKLFRMSNDGKLIPVLFVDEDKAQAVVTALNRMKL